MITPLHPDPLALRLPSVLRSQLSCWVRAVKVTTNHMTSSLQVFTNPSCKQTNLQRPDTWAQSNPDEFLSDVEWTRLRTSSRPPAPHRPIIGFSHFALKTQQKVLEWHLTERGRNLTLSIPFTETQLCTSQQVFDNSEWETRLLTSTMLEQLIVGQLSASSGPERKADQTNKQQVDREKIIMRFVPLEDKI